MNEINIDQLTEAELLNLNRQVVERLRGLQKGKAQAEMTKFQVGERVVFYPKNRLPVEGKLKRFNKKSVTVISDRGEHWRVSPSLLHKLES